MMKMSGLKLLIFLLCATFVQPQESSRTCSQSLMVALKTIYEQSANEVCVSLLFLNSFDSVICSHLFITVCRRIEGYIGSDF